MSIASFLGNLTYGGKKLTSNVDPLSGGLTTLNTPFLFGQVLQNASQAGGALSPITTDRGFAAQVQAMANAERNRQSELMAGMQNAGISQVYAERALAEEPYRFASQVGATRGMLEQQRSMLELDAMSNLANVTADAATQQKTMQLQKFMFDKSLKEQKKANKLGSLLNLGALAIGALSLPLGGGMSLASKLFGGGGGSSSSGTSGGGSSAPLPGNFDVLTTGFPSPSAFSLMPHGGSYFYGSPSFAPFTPPMSMPFTPPMSMPFTQSFY
jgi:hypothetical protein